MWRSGPPVHKLRDVQSAEAMTLLLQFRRNKRVSRNNNRNAFLRLSLALLFLHRQVPLVRFWGPFFMQPCRSVDLTALYNQSTRSNFSTRSDTQRANGKFHLQCSARCFWEPYKKGRVLFHRRDYTLSHLEAPAYREDPACS